MKGNVPRWLVLITLAPVALPLAWGGLSALQALFTSDIEPETIHRLALLLARSLVLALAAGTISAALGTVLALGLVRRAIVGRFAIGLLLVAGMSVPLVVHAGGWISVVGPYGWITPSMLGLGTGVRTGYGAMAAVVLIHAMASVPLSTAIIVLSLITRGGEAEEWGLLHGRPRSVLWHIVLPMHRPALLRSLLLTMAILLSDMSVTDLFAVRTIAEEVYAEIESGAPAAPTTLLAFLLGGIGAVCFGRPTSWWALPRASRRNLTWNGPRLDRAWETRAIDVASYGVAGLLLLPAAGLARQWLAGTVRLETLFVAEEWRIVSSSLIVSAGAGLGATLASSVLAWWCVRGRSVGRDVVFFLMVAALFIPGPTVGLAMVEMVSRPSPLDLLGRFYDSVGMVIWGQTARVMPWLYLGQMAGLAGSSLSRWEVLKREGASEWMLYLLGPLGEYRAVFCISFALGTALAVGELATTKIVSPPGFDSATSLLFSLLHVGTTQAQARLALTMACTSAVCGAMMLLFARGFLRAR